MRKIRGWILNLTDGLGPDPGTAEVAARLNDDESLNLEEHTLGYLNLTHQTDGSGSPTHAASNGHFGWDMEFSPGPITTRIVANDPEPVQNRARLPDESAQIGKAFHSDLERLGWAAGRDCLVWGAIEGATPPTAATWATDPWSQGDWGVSFAGAAPGRVLLNRGIGFLGGVVFSVETPDYPLQVPVLGEDAAEPNSGSADRWDLLYAYMDTDSSPTNPTYGKQGIRIQPGGATIPVLNQVVGERRMVIHALKMAAGGSEYAAASDLRPWENPPPGVSSGEQIVKSWQIPEASPYHQDVPSFTSVPSILNTVMGQDKLVLPLSRRWMGQLNYRCSLSYGGPAAFFYLVFTTAAYDASGTVIAATDYIAKPTRGSERWTLPGSVQPYGTGANYHWLTPSVSLPIRTIPGFTTSSLMTDSRSWTSLAFAVQIVNNASQFVHVNEQHMNVQLWPVP